MINTQSDNQILEHQSEFYSSYLKIKDNPRYKKIWKYIWKRIITFLVFLFLLPIHRFFFYYLNQIPIREIKLQEI